MTTYEILQEFIEKEYPHIKDDTKKAYLNLLNKLKTYKYSINSTTKLINFINEYYTLETKIKLFSILIRFFQKSKNKLYKLYTIRENFLEEARNKRTDEKVKT